MFKVLAKSELSCNFFSSTKERFIVHFVANQIDKLMAELGITKLVNIGNSFSWVSDYLQHSRNKNVIYFSYSKSSFSTNFNNAKQIDSIFNLSLYRKNISSNSIKNLHLMFDFYGLTVSSLLSTPRLYLDMSKTGKGLRSFIHELELFVFQSDPDKIEDNLMLFKKFNTILVFQPKEYKIYNIEHTLFKGYQLYFLKVNANDEKILENFCDNDSIRLIPSNPIDGDFKYYESFKFNDEALIKRNFFS